MGKGLGAGGLEKQDAFPLTRAIFTQGLKQTRSVPPAPGWESPWKTSSLPQQHPVPAKHSLKPELLRRPVCQQPRGSTTGPSTAGVIHQGMRWLLATQETAVAMVGPGLRPAGAPSARRSQSPRSICRDFSDGPVAKTPCFHCRGYGLIFGRGSSTSCLG